MTTVAFVANTNTLKVNGLTNKADGSFINNATVTATVVDGAGVQVVGVAWPVTLAYVAASNGDYSVALADTLAFVDDVFYTARITVDGGTDLKAFWPFKFRAKARS